MAQAKRVDEISERERYEAWAESYIDKRGHDKDFKYDEWQSTWGAWQAALADRPEQPVAIEPMAIAHGNTVKRELWLEITSAGQHLQEGDKLYAAPVARPEPAQPLRQFGDVRYAAAVDLVRNKEVTLSELWVVWGPPEKDGKRYPEYCAGWPEACHEHINDALANELDEAKDWIVRQAFLTPQEPAQPVAPNSWKLVPLSLTDNMMGAFSYGLERFVKDRAPAADMNTIRANYQEAWEYLLAAAPRSHPAPSEAGAERQEPVK